MRRATFFLTALALTAVSLPASAQEWEREGEQFHNECTGAEGFLSAVKSCGSFLFHDGKPVRLSTPTSVVPGGGTALGAVYIQPFNIHEWTDSNFTLEGGSSVRQFWYSNATAS